MATPPPAYERFEQAFRRGDHLTVLAEGDRVADQLSAAGLDDLLPEVLVQIGSVHAAQDRYEPAAAYLEQGLTLAAGIAARAQPPATTAPPAHAAPGPAAPPAPRPAGPFQLAGPPPAGPGLPGAPGSPPPISSAARRAARVANRLDWFELALIDVRLRTGRYADVLARVPRLVDPTHPADVRFSANRAQAAALAAQGQFEGAHHVLNTAGGIANRLNSRFRGALVEGDRAVVLASQGRLFEAITAADRVLASLIRPPLGESQQWSNAEAAAVALTISRAASDAADHLTAERMLLLGTTATQRVGGTYLQAQLDLTRGVFWLLQGDLDGAEAALVTAGRQFGLLGCTPAAAAATMAQGRLAQARGLERSARPLYQRALEDFRRLGQPREFNELNRLLTALGPADRTEPNPGPRPS